MGNIQHPKQRINEGEIFIEIHNNTCIGGEYTQGTVHLEIFKIYHAKTLQFRFKGYERVCASHSPSIQNVKKNTNHSKFHKDGCKNLIVNNMQILREYSSGFTPVGQFSFPFRFQIPFWLPPSFVYSENGHLKSSIYYALEAFLIEDQEGIQNNF